jgi:DNA-binding winged helix-turn-helix (wHTH) protein
MRYKLAEQIFTVSDDSVSNHGMELPLTQRGHDCLILLLQSDNSILSKEYLMTHLWQDVIVSDDSLFKVIQEIRKVLLDLGLNKDVLQNVYGKGYQIKPQIKAVKQQFWGVKQISITAVLILMCVALIIWFWPKGNQLNDQLFAKLVSDVETNQTDVSNQWSELKIDRYSSKVDQLRMAYLKGLQSYQSGQYDASIAQLKAGIEAYGNGDSNQVLADSYLMLCKMYIYRTDKTALLDYLNQADYHYQAIGDEYGQLATGVSRARYLQSIYQFPESIAQLQQVITAAEQQGDQFHVMRAHANLAYSYQQMHQMDRYISVLQTTLEMALAQSSGRYAALAFGQLSEVYLLQDEPVKAMKFAHQALNYVLAQHDTNIFQQGFSAYYNLLHELGHFELAKKYLSAAIKLQAKFNNESLLVEAEFNLMRVHVSMQKFEQSQLVIQKLKHVELSEVERLELQSLQALLSYQLDDNITAYTLAKQVYETEPVDPRVKFQAGIILASASHQLERKQETIIVFRQLKNLQQSQWKFEYDQYLQLAMMFYAEIESDENTLKQVQQEQQQFIELLTVIKEQTVTSQPLIDALDAYITKINNQ